MHDYTESQRLLAAAFIALAGVLVPSAFVAWGLWSRARR